MGLPYGTVVFIHHWSMIIPAINLYLKGIFQLAMFDGTRG